MKGMERREILQEKDSRRTFDYFLNPYELSHEPLLKEEETFLKDPGTGPNCLR